MKTMEGTLWKWTNYWNGWQTRWFVLKDGILSYYKSQEEVSQGCKGSMKVQACEINVSQIDNTRMDLVIPGEQHMYLRAATSQERQQWLVALGSSKACVRNRKDIVELNPDALKTKKSELRLYCDLLMQQVHLIKTASRSENGPELQKMDEATKMLGATCDTFIKALEECMRLTSANVIFDPPISSDIILPPNNINSTAKKKSITRTISEEMT
ncbi:hypothetical protein HHI36_006840 [Cryptolaemus montrouzieri]|uniref:PH domain-containing protein n=1 Tax=Cryptolaemus montrouzieri TaxID=559131 RepID=A0ABD2MN91_9CUCU